MKNPWISVPVLVLFLLVGLIVFKSPITPVAGLIVYVAIMIAVVFVLSPMFIGMSPGVQIAVMIAGVLFGALGGYKVTKELTFPPPRISTDVCHELANIIQQTLSENCSREDMWAAIQQIPNLDVGSKSFLEEYRQALDKDMKVLSQNPDQRPVFVQLATVRGDHNAAIANGAMNRFVEGVNPMFVAGTLLVASMLYVFSLHHRGVPWPLTVSIAVGVLAYVYYKLGGVTADQNIKVVLKNLFILGVVANTSYLSISMIGTLSRWWRGNFVASVSTTLLLLVGGYLTSPSVFTVISFPSFTNQAILSNPTLTVAMCQSAMLAGLAFGQALPVTVNTVWNWIVRSD